MRHALSVIARIDVVIAKSLTTSLKSAQWSTTRGTFSNALIMWQWHTLIITISRHNMFDISFLLIKSTVVELIERSCDVMLRRLTGDVTWRDVMSSEWTKTPCIGSTTAARQPPPPPRLHRPTAVLADFHIRESIVRCRASSRDMAVSTVMLSVNHNYKLPVRASLALHLKPYSDITRISSLFSRSPSL